MKSTSKMFELNPRKQKKIYAEKKIDRQLPRNYDSKDFHYELFANVTLPESKLLFFSKVNISYLGIVFKRFMISTYLDLSMPRRNAWLFYVKHVLSTLLNKKAVRIKEKKLLLIHDDLSISGGYYHWLLETLPRLLIVEECLEDHHLILPEGLEDYKLESLKAFKVKNISFVREYEYLSVDHLISPGHLAPKSENNPDVIKGLKKKLIDYVSDMALEVVAPENVFLSRRKSPKRFLKNEKEVEQLLREFDYTTVCFEDYTFFEQVAILEKAKFLVTTHGAGVSNVLFLNEGASYLEFRAEDQGYSGMSFYKLSETLRLNYFYQKCKPTLPGDYINTDLLVDIQQLKENIEIMIKSES